MLKIAQPTISAARQNVPKARIAISAAIVTARRRLMGKFRLRDAKFVAVYRLCVPGEIPITI